MAVRAEAGDGVLTRLSPRERHVLELTSLGRTNAQTGADLQITTHAVKFHLASIYRKLGVANRTEAAAYCVSALGRERESLGS